MRFARLVCACLSLLLGNTGLAAPTAGERSPETIVLADDGKSLVPVVIHPDAATDVETLARELADGLERISGAQFKVVRDKQLRGIVVGTAHQWPEIVPPVTADLSPRLAREDYVLRSSASSLVVVGRETIGLQNAVWDLFYRLGFRQYVPGSKWEIWPDVPRLSLAIDVVERPDYFHRGLMFTGLAAPTMLKRVGVVRGPADVEAEAGYRAQIDQWRVRNRLVSGFELNTSHAYGEIVRRNPDHFTAHPEDIIPRESGETRKLDAARSTLLDVAARDALGQFANDPALDSVSLEPSDGGGWRLDSPLGRPTNQALTLANHVARAVRAKYPGCKVGMLAYNEHSPPPDMDVDPDVIISIATMFLRGGVSVDQAIDGWRTRGADIGIREYLSLYGGSRDLPGRARADDLHYVVTTIPHFHEQGARYWRSEVSRTWFPHGLGYYLAARLLWDTEEAADRDLILDDFYRRSFGAAADEMRLLHQRYLLAEGKPLLSEDLVGRMYRQLQVALDRADSADVKARIADYVGYARYLELTLAADAVRSGDGGKAAQELAQFEFRFRHTPMLNAGGFFRQLGRSGKSIHVDAGWSSEPLTVDEAEAMVRRGVENNRITPFEPTAFSDELVPPADVADGPRGAGDVILTQTAHLWVYLAEPGSIRFTVSGNQNYANRGPVRLRLFATADPLVDRASAEREVPADVPRQSVELTSSFAGLHRLEVSDGGAATRISWLQGRRVVLPVGVGDEAAVPRSYQYDGVFYVPRGTKIVGGYVAAATGKIFFPDGREALDLKSIGPNSYFSIEVLPASDAACWRVTGVRRGFSLLTVPHYLARSADEMLVPKETLSDGSDSARSLRSDR